MKIFNYIGQGLCLSKIKTSGVTPPLLRGHVLICLHVFEAFHHQKIPVGVLKIKYNLPKNFPFYIFSVILHIFVWFAFLKLE